MRDSVCVRDSRERGERERGAHPSGLDGGLHRRGLRVRDGVPCVRFEVECLAFGAERLLFGVR